MSVQKPNLTAKGKLKAKNIGNNKLLNKKITFFHVIFYLMKLQLFDKSILFLTAISIGISAIWGLVLATAATTDADIYVLFQWYIVIAAFVINFLLIMKVLSYFLISKNQDKTLYVIIVQNISRVLLFLAIFTVTMLISFVTMIVDSFLITLVYTLVSIDFNTFLIKTVLVLLMYVFLTSLCLTSFFSLLMVIVKQQFVLIISSLLLAVFFVNSLPNTFFKQKEELTIMDFDGGYSEYQSDVLDTFEVNDMIKNGNIRYPNLSKFVYEYFINNNLSSDTFSQQSSINMRKMLWDKIGITNTVVKDYTLNDVKFTTKPDEWVGWKTNNHKINIQFSLNYSFDSLSELESKANDTSMEYHLIIKELNEYVKDFLKNYSNIDNFYSDYIHFYYDYISLAPGKQIIENISSDDSLEPEDKTKIVTKDLVSSMFSGYYNTITDFSISKCDTPNVNGVCEDLNSNVVNFINKLKDPVMIAVRILENYLIKYSTNYGVFTTYPVKKQSWVEYESNMLSSYWLNMFNIFSTTVQNFTTFAPKSYKDIWFKNNSNVDIDLRQQEIIFMSYKKFYLQVNQYGVISKDSINNYIEPYYFMLIQMFIGIFNFSIAMYIFCRKDFR